MPLFDLENTLNTMFSFDDFLCVCDYTIQHKYSQCTHVNPIPMGIFYEHL